MSAQHTTLALRKPVAEQHPPAVPEQVSRAGTTLHRIRGEAREQLVQYRGSPRLRVDAGTGYGRSFAPEAELPARIRFTTRWWRGVDDPVDVAPRRRSRRAGRPWWR